MWPGVVTLYVPLSEDPVRAARVLLGLGAVLRELRR